MVRKLLLNKRSYDIAVTGLMAPLVQSSCWRAFSTTSRFGGSNGLPLDDPDCAQHTARDLPFPKVRGVSLWVFMAVPAVSHLHFLVQPWPGV